MFKKISFILSIRSSTIVQQIIFKLFIDVKKYFLIILEFLSSLTKIEIINVIIFPSFSFQLRKIFVDQKNLEKLWLYIALSYYMNLFP